MKWTACFTVAEPEEHLPHHSTEDPNEEVTYVDKEEIVTIEYSPVEHDNPGLYSIVTISSLST